MLTYITRRVFQSCVILAFLSIFFFVILNIQPGGPCLHYRMSSNPLLQARYHTCAVTHGLDQPLYAQYLRWLGLTLHGDFGVDDNDVSVATDITSAIPPTLLLIGISYLFQQLLALPLGILGALKRHGVFDYVPTIVSYAFLAMPTFWLGFMLILIFSATLNWLPNGGILSPALNVAQGGMVFGEPDYWQWALANPGVAVGDFIRHLILPGLTLALVGIATDSRFMRASMLDVISQDYVRTARAKGLPRRVIVVKHTVRNALLPVITNVGSVFIPSLVSGAIVTETIFTWPGMGNLYGSAVGVNDQTTLQAILLLSALVVLVGNLVADIAYAWADPRIRYS